MPLVGAYVADQYLGRYRTIMYSIGAALIGHFILIVSAIPSVIAHPGGAIGCFSLGLIIMGVGTGGFKYVMFTFDPTACRLPSNLTIQGQTSPFL